MENIILAVFMIVGGVLLRLTPHVANFAPISATALFGGAYLNKRFAILVPLIAMIVSDYLLLYVSPYGNDFSKVHPLSAMFHATTLYVWGSYLITSIIGIWLKSHMKPSNIIAVSLLSSFQFFIITNLGVWAEGMYSRGFDGLITSYILGLPFLKWTILGDIFYTGVFFGTYALAVKSSNKLALAFN